MISTYRKVARAAVWATRVPDLTNSAGRPVHGNVAEARELLECIGLVQPGEHHISTGPDVDAPRIARRGARDSGRTIPTHGTPVGADLLHPSGRLCADCQAAVAQQARKREKRQRRKPTS